jgi:CRP-like cAMP-binding protein
MLPLGGVVISDHFEEIVGSPLFSGIESGDLRTMLKCLGGFVRDYKKGEYISVESESVKNIGVILDGSVQMIKEDIWGGKSILAVMERHQLFGETFACGTDTVSAVTFCASADTRVLFLPFYRVLHTCSNSCAFHNKLIENMVTLIANKNRSLMEKLDAMSKKNLREKILTYLSIQSQHQGGRYFEIPLGRIELADYLCTDRSALTRELSSMRDDGLIDFDRNTFRLLK